MSAPPISMRKLKDLLRLKYEAGLSQRQIAGALRLSLGVVNKYLHAACCPICRDHLAAAG
jgi:DNA-binding transcriptional regulator LsrR (DeoR family)